MYLQLLAGVACLIAAVLQLAVYRDPTITDTQMRRNGRRIIIVGLFMATAYCGNAIYSGNRPSVLFLMLSLIALSQTIFALSDLMPHLEKEHPWTSRLNSSP